MELQNQSTEISNMISIRKEKYYVLLSKKLNNPSTRSKTYLSILKSFYKGNKVPSTPPLLVNNEIIRFHRESQLLQCFFLFSM